MADNIFEKLCNGEKLTDYEIDVIVFLLGKSVNIGKMKRRNFKVKEILK